MTETYKDALPQITISILNDKIAVDLGTSNNPSLGSFISGNNDPEKLSNLYSSIDIKYGITNNICSYDSNIWETEGEGLDRFVKFIQTRDLADAPKQEFALAYHMYTNFNLYLGV